MSNLSNIQNANNFNNLDGLSVINADEIYIDGQQINLDNYVPYTNANQTVDLGNQNIKTTHVATQPSDLVNLQLLIDSNIFNDSANALTYLNKTTTSDQTVSGKVSFNKELVVADQKPSNLSSRVIVDANYKTNITSAWPITKQGFGSISNAGGIFQTTTTNANTIEPILYLTNITASKRYRIKIGILIEDSTYDWGVIFRQSINGIDGEGDVLHSEFITSNTIAFKPVEFTFNATITGVLNLYVSTNNPSGVGTLKWKDFYTYEMGVELENVSLPTQTPDRVAVINHKNQLVASGINTTKLGFLDNVNSDIQTQLNSKANSVDLLTKANLSGGNTFTGTQTYSDQTASRVAIYDSSKVLVSSSISTTTLGYLDNVSSDIQTQLNSKAPTSALSNYVLKAGDAMTGNLTLNGTDTSSGVLAKRYYLSARSDNQDEKAGDEKFGPWYGLGDSGISGFTGKPCLAGFYGCALRSGLGYMVLDENGRVGIGRTDPQNLLDIAGTSRNTISGTYADTTAYNIYTTTANHYDGNASTTYVMSGPSGYLTLAKKTTRNETEACIMMGTNNDLSEIVSRSTDGSEWMPLNYACSQCYFVGVNQPYSSRASNPQTSQFQIRNHSNGQRLYLGTYYTGGSGSCSTIQTSDFYSGADHGTDLLINPLGGYVSIGSYGVKDPVAKFTINSDYGADEAGGFCINASDNTASAGFYRLHLFPYVQSGGNVAYRFRTKNQGTSYESFSILSTGSVKFETTVKPFTIEASGNGNPTSNGLYVYNSNNTANQDAIVSVRVGGSSAGDAFVSYDIAGEYGWTSGLCNSDNSFRINKGWDNVRTNTHTYFFNNGVMDIKGGAGGSWAYQYLTRPGGLIIGRTDTNYGGEYQTNNNNVAGFMMECLDQTEIQIHDSGARLASFMYYNSNNFTIGRDSGYGLTQTTIAGNLNLSLGTLTTTALFNNTSSRLMFRDTDGYVRHGACSTWRYENNSTAWTGGLTITNLYYKPNNTCSVIINISGSWWATSGGLAGMNVMIYQQNASLNRITKTMRKYFNITGNHETISFPLVIPSSELSGIDWFSVYIFGTGPITSDSNDTLWMNVMVIG